MTALSEELHEESKIKNVSPLCGDAVDHYWPLIWDCLKEVPSIVQLYTESWCFHIIKKGQWQVYAYSDSEIRGIMVTRINEFPKANVLEVVGVSGVSGVEFLQNLDDVCEHLARQQGCTYLATNARPGMERLLTRKHRAARLFSVLVRPVGLLRRS